jgi:type IV pilus assembly protein PilW
MSNISLAHLRSRRAAGGFTLVELMIALLIGLFLTGGLLTLVFAMRRSSTTQAGMSQLQDDERMGMSILTNAVQSAGYYPNPLLNTALTFFPVTTVAPVFGTAGQSMTGTHTSATVPDTLAVRYTTAGSATANVHDNTINCLGQTSTTQKTWTQTFQIDTTNNVLQCVFNDGVNPNVTVNLVTGVSNLQVLYGIATTTTAPSTADSYVNATQIAAGGWSKVVSVMVTLTYVNPLKNQPGQSSVGAAIQPTIDFKRVIALMNNTGVDS